MMIMKSDEAEKAAVLQAANLILAAIRTAPKSRGIDNIVAAVLSGSEKDELSAEMKAIGEKNGNNTFLRDAKGILDSSAVILLGSRFKPIGLKLCGLCGFPDCASLEKNNGICLFNPTDLGIALGSAVSTAAALKIDNRIMYTAGFAAVRKKMLGEEVKLAYGIPLSVTGKNIFFDRP